MSTVREYVKSMRICQQSENMSTVREYVNSKRICQQ